MASAARRASSCAKLKSAGPYCRSAAPEMNVIAAEFPIASDERNGDQRTRPSSRIIRWWSSLTAYSRNAASSTSGTSIAWPVRSTRLEACGEFQPGG